MKKIKSKLTSFLFVFAILIIVLNLKAAKKFYFSYSLLENPKDKRWESVLEALDFKDKEKYLACCVGEDIKKRIEKAEKKQQAQIEKLNEVLKLNPYNWQAMLELARLYKKRGEEKKALELQKKAKSLFPDLKFVTSY